MDASRRLFTVGDTTVNEGDWITLDGATGRVFIGDLPTMPSDVVRVTAGQLRAEDLRRIRVSRASFHGPMARAASGSAPTPTRRTMHASRATSAPKGSASAAPSTCSSRATGSPPCAR